MSHWIWNRELFIFSPLIVLAPGRCLFTTGIHTHSNQRKSEARISNSCKSLVAAMGKHSSAPRFEITNVSIPEHRGYRGALCGHQGQQTIASLVSGDGFFPLHKTAVCYRWINHTLLAHWTLTLWEADSHWLGVVRTGGRGLHLYKISSYSLFSLGWLLASLEVSQRKWGLGIS